MATTNKTPEQEFQDFLLQLDSKTAKKMLAMLDDPESCTPQLFNAIGKLLERHNFQISRFNPDEEVLQGLSKTMANYDNVFKLAVNED